MTSRTPGPRDPRSVPPAVADETLARATRWAQVTARDIMKTDVVTIDYSMPLSEVERVFAEHRISGAPVTDEGGKIVGIVSLKDLVEQYAEDPDSHPRRGRGFYHLSNQELGDEEDESDSFEVPAEAEETAQDIMTSALYVVPPTAGLKEIATQMVKHRIHRVLVEDHGEILGLVSTLEILDALSA